jgi:hypothetical protein
VTDTGSNKGTTVKVHRVLATVVGCAALVGCQTAQMQVSPELNTVAAFDVTGANPRVWNAPLSFGPWTTTQVREGLTWGFGYRLLGIEASYAQQPYRLAMSAGSATMQAECITRALVLSREGLEVDPSFGTLPALSCGFAGAGEGMLRLRMTATNAEEGEMTFGASRWTLRSTDRFEGSPIRSSGPVGYELSRDGAIVAAVETINRGRVWISPALPEDERARAAVAAAALLLYRPARSG